jgi:hypothetical protein
MSRPRLAARAAVLVLGAAPLVACDALRKIVEPAPAEPPPIATDLRFHAGDLRLGHPRREHVRNLNASVAITDSRWDYFYRTLGPSLDLWAADARLDINPNLIAAILVAESRMDSLLVSLNPDHGIAQLTQHSDAFILDRAPRPSFGMDWMATEAQTWPRHPAVHRFDATREQVVALMESGDVSAQTEYFFRPLQALRGLLFDLRLIEATWTTDGVTWGQFGTWAGSTAARRSPSPSSSTSSSSATTGVTRSCGTWWSATGRPGRPTSPPTRRRGRSTSPKCAAS